MNFCNYIFSLFIILNITVQSLGWSNSKEKIDWKMVKLKLKNSDDQKLMQKIFELDKGLDGDFAQDFQDHLVSIFKENPRLYVIESEKYYKDRFSCATWWLVNESSSISVDEIKNLAKKAMPKDAVTLKAFLESVERQNRAITVPANSGDYRSCK